MYLVILQEFEQGFVPGQVGGPDPLLLSPHGLLVRLLYPPRPLVVADQTDADVGVQRFRRQLLSNKDVRNMDIYYSPTFGTALESNKIRSLP